MNLIDIQVDKLYNEEVVALASLIQGKTRLTQQLFDLSRKANIECFKRGL